MTKEAHMASPMGAGGSPVTSAEAAAYRSEYEGASGDGWIAFSGIALFIAGLLNLVDGLWALDRSDAAGISEQVEDLLWYSESLEVWGWFYIVTGVLLLAAGVGVFARTPWARWTGILFASASIVVNMMWVFVFPIAALIHVLLGTLVVYGLTVYGRRELA